MPKYLVEFSYSVEGAKGLIKEGGTARRAATEKAVQSMGGKLEAYYFAFGETDGFGLVDMPDNVSVAAINLTIGASGAVRTKTTVLITPEEVDAAVKKSPAYRPPGQ
ncbi:MAG TPA: GYD domain-containing protein [Anaerolineales bacterium]|nr:GYD domain-containing protein [Anaerolineales bacterium]